MENEVFPIRIRDLNLEIEAGDGVHVPGVSSRDMAHFIPSCEGKSVLDLGCGTGLFGIVAAKLGAREVWATDINPSAVACARRNAARNQVDLRVETGDLFEPVGDRAFDLILTNPPQTPAPDPARGPKFAGEDGLRYFTPLLRQATGHLAPGGELLTMVLSLASRSGFEALLSERFSFREVGSAIRPFTREEYDGYWPGLFEFLMERRRAGLASFEEDPEGKCSFRIHYYRAWPK